MRRSLRGWLPSRVLAVLGVVGPVIGLDDALDERMPDDVARGEAGHARDGGRTASKPNRPSNAVAKDSKRSVSANPGARV